MTDSLTPSLNRLTAKDRAKLLISLGVTKAKGIKPYITTKRPPPNSKAATKPTSTRNRPVRCIDTGETFPSITACAIAHGIQPSHLSSHLKGYLYAVAKRKYEYIVGEEKDKLIEASKVKGKGHSRAPKAVRCVNDGREFRSLNACAKHYGLGLSNLQLHLATRGEVIASLRGRKFEYVVISKRIT